MIELSPVTIEDKAMLQKLLQEYLREMSAFYDIEPDGEGNYPYRYFEHYFCEAGRHALFICAGGEIAGFALINSHSYIGENPDYVLAEFCILPAYRRQGMAARCFDLICKRFPGSWELKYSAKNLPAARLWNRVTEKYHPRKHLLEENEEVICFRTDR